MAAMDQSGILARILPGASASGLAPLVHLESEVGLAPDPAVRLATLGGEETKGRLRLSKEVAQRTSRLSEWSKTDTSLAELGYRLGNEEALNAAILRAASLGVPLSSQALEDIRRGASQSFPIKAADLMPDFSGPALGRRLAKLEADWIASGFQLSRDDLLT